MKTRTKLACFTLVAILSLTSCMREPMACCDVPATGTVGQSVSFSSECSMDASKYEWDFGDGTKSTDAMPTHMYNIAGTYTVKLMVMSKNEKKMNETAKSITIK